MSFIKAAIQKVGDRGRYQKILLVFFVFIYIQLGLMLIGSSFIFMNPIYQCPGYQSPTEQSACSLIDQGVKCRITNDFTAAAYAELTCDRKGDRNIVQSAPYIGAIIGLLVITPLADSKGKKRIFMIAQSLCLAGIIRKSISYQVNIGGVYLKATAMLVIGQIFIGAGGYTILIIGYVFVSQLMQNKFKQYSIITLNAVWALSQVLIAGLYFWFNQWNNFIIIFLLIPNIGLILFSSFYLCQSPYFLIQQKMDIDLALKSVKHIATINNKNLGVMIQVENDLRMALKHIQDQQKQQTQKTSKFAIFKQKKYLKILLIVAVLQFFANAYYYGVQFSLGQVGTNFGSNILLAGVIETVAFFSSNLFITKIPRKKGMIFFSAICVILGQLFFIKFSDIGQTILLVICRLFNAYVMAIIPMLQNEPFPNRYRSVAWGYIQGLSQLGNFVTPYIVTACDNASINPLIVFSFMLAGLGIFPVLFLRETLGKEEEELQQKQSLLQQQGKKQSIMSDGL